MGFPKAYKLCIKLIVLTTKVSTMDIKKIRCNMCYTVYEETDDFPVYECEKCKTGDYLMEGFIDQSLK